MAHNFIHKGQQAVGDFATEAGEAIADAAETFTDVANSIIKTSLLSNFS